MSTDITRTPGELFATIPTVLGFFPQESLVILTLGKHSQPDENTTRFQLGPVLRVDLAALDEPEAGEQLGALLGTLSCSHAFLLVVSEESLCTGETLAVVEANLVDRINRAILALQSQHIPVAGVWTTNGIYKDETYHRVVGTHADNEVNNSNHLLVPMAASQWDKGTIGDPAATNAMRALLRAGHSVSLDREELLESFAPQHPPLGDDTMRRIMRRADGRLSKLIVRGDAGQAQSLRAPQVPHPDDIARIMCDYTELLHRYVPAPVTSIANNGDSCPQSGEDPCRTIDEDPQALMTLALVLGDSLIRDLILETLVPENADAGCQVMSAAARVFRGQRRANALTVLGLYSSVSQCRVHFVPALHVALREEPQHRLSQLALDCAHRGLFSELHAACRAASAAVRREYRIPRTVRKAQEPDTSEEDPAAAEGKRQPPRPGSTTGLSKQSHRECSKQRKATDSQGCVAVPPTNNRPTARNSRRA